MAESVVSSGARNVTIETVSASQASTDSTVVVTSSDIDARPWKSISYTIKVATNAVTWSVYGANISDFSDEVVVQSAASVAAGNASSYSVAQAPFGFYRVKIVSTGAGQSGTATITGMGKW